LAARASATVETFAHHEMPRAFSRPTKSGGAGLLLATWAVAFVQAHQTLRQSGDTEEAKAAFLAIVDPGSFGLSRNDRHALHLCNHIQLETSV
jgi:hypothetical protein